jgi:hypothetical protein
MAQIGHPVRLGGSIEGTLGGMVNDGGSLAELGGGVGMLPSTWVGSDGGASGMRLPQLAQNRSEAFTCAPQFGQKRLVVIA